MKCPECSAELMLHNREGVDIDVCPACRGVWLDRGELDKIIDRSSRYDDPGDRRGHGDVDDDARHRDRGGYRRKSFWSELFD